jgi:hypothetical protein
MRARAAIAALAAAGAAAAAPGAALAARLDVSVGPPQAHVGNVHFARGRMLADDGTPLAGRRVALEVRLFPFSGPFVPVNHATTDRNGHYAFDDLAIDRNADVRVQAFDGTTSGIARAFTYPAHTLHFRAVSATRIRLTQRYMVPAAVKLTRRTLFYVGRASSKSAPIAATAPTTRTRAGRFKSVAFVNLPKSFKGRFHYASCFRYSPGSGMGDPAQGCPGRFRF